MTQLEFYIDDCKVDQLTVEQSKESVETLRKKRVKLAYALIEESVRSLH